MNHKIESEITALENKLKESMLKSDVETLEQLLANDLIFINHLGLRVSKADDIALHASGLLSIKAIEFSDFSVKCYSNLVIVYVNAAIQGTFDGSEANGCFAFSRVWANDNAQWRVISAHSTVIS